MAPLLLLLFLPFALCCETVPVTQCEKLSFVPGHNLVGEGFDIVRMKTTGAFVVDVHNYITGGQHGNCTVCENKLLNEKQKVPSSVVDWRTKVQCRRSLSSQVYESASSVLKETTNSLSLGWKVGLSVPMVGGVATAGTLSMSAKFAKSHSSQDKYSFTSHSFSCRYYSFRLHANPPLTKEFASSIRSLPAKYDDASYKHFISIYGTHFLRRVDLGGRVKSTTALKTCQVSMKGLSVHDISICLSKEASGVIEGVNVSAQAKFCAERQNKLERSKSFSGSFSDRVTEILGGNGEQQDILFNPDQSNGYDVWLKSLKTIPGVVSYSLSSLHMLVKNDSARRAGLQTAISKYITKNAISTACPSGCKVGRRENNCACKCSGHDRVDRDCCPNQPGVATLNVTVKSADGLWGDLFSKTDGYVKVFYGKAAKGETPVINNNNFPRWNYHIRIGTVVLTEKNPLRFEVWDRDNRFDDDLLGKASFVPKQGSEDMKFGLKHGSFVINYSAKCGPSLTGSYCEKYAPTPDGDGALNYYQPFDRKQPVEFQKSNSFARNKSLL